jgi:hypothetical protein
MTRPPSSEDTRLSDFSELVIKPLDEASAASLTEMSARINVASVRDDLAEKLRPIVAIDQSRAWVSSAEQQRWQSLVSGASAAVGDGYKAQITDYLVAAVCSRKWSNGAAASGVARRAMSQNFRGDPVALYDRLRSDSCPASKTVAPRVLREFSSYADLARGN